MPLGMTRRAFDFQAMASYNQQFMAASSRYCRLCVHYTMCAENQATAGHLIFKPWLRIISHLWLQGGTLYSSRLTPAREQVPSLFVALTYSSTQRRTRLQAAGAAVVPMTAFVAMRSLYHKSHRKREISAKLNPFLIQSSVSCVLSKVPVQPSPLN